MIRLTEALNALGTPEFTTVLKREIEALGAHQLPLQQGLSMSSHALDDAFTTMIIGVTEFDGGIRAKIGVFFAGVVAGCSCTDDPTPMNEQTEYCVVQVEIDRATAEATITLLPE